MGKTAVIYWSGTGNTEAMAMAVLEGAKEKGEAELFKVSEITADEAAEFDNLLLGCPAMGAEVLEESEFEPFFTELKGKLAGKNVGLLGSYGWGDGEWMRSWEERCKESGACGRRSYGKRRARRCGAGGVQSFGKKRGGKIKYSKKRCVRFYGRIFAA